MKLSSSASSAIAGFESIGLTELESFAALRERKDRKYLVAGNDLGVLIESVDGGFMALDIDGERSFDYESVYFDTPELDSYFMSERRRPARFKVRIRSYLASGVSFLEIKERRRDGLTAKHRVPHPFEFRDQFTPETVSTLAETPSIGDLAPRLQPTLTVRYKRSTLVEKRTASRITFDTELTASPDEGCCLEADGFVLVETKSIGNPTLFDRLLWRRHCRPTSFSKYCTLIAALDPSLPAHKWNRTLRQYFDWRPGTV